MLKGMYIHIEHYLCLPQSIDAEHCWGQITKMLPNTQMRFEMQTISTSHTEKSVPCFSTNILLEGLQSLCYDILFLLLMCTFKKYILTSLTLGSVL